MLLPKTVTDLLEPCSGVLACCSRCGEELLQDSNSVFTCPDCQFPRYCSEPCRQNHKLNHEHYCRRYRESVRETGDDELFPFQVGDHMLLTMGLYMSNKVLVGDRILQMGVHSDRLPNRAQYFRRALREYLDGMEHDGFLDPNRFGSRAEDRVLLLLVVLGGGAQMLLDWLSFTAGGEEENQTEESPPPSVESQEKVKHPLLFLHGLFDKDTKEGETTVANLYLLACCRSLMEHRQKKAMFEAYQSAVQHGIDAGIFPEKIDIVNGNVASFLWGADGYEYGEAVQGEIPRILEHLQKHKINGAAFLQHACDSSVNFSPLKAPQLLTNRRARIEVPDFGRILLLTHDMEPVTSVPELWLLYQDSLLAMKPRHYLAEFLPAEDSTIPSKNKRD